MLTPTAAGIDVPVALQQTTTIDGAEDTQQAITVLPPLLGLYAKHGRGRHSGPGGASDMD